MPGDALAPSSAQAAAFIQELINSDIRDAVVCPGSRSQALALVLAAAEQDGLIRLHVRIDERSAAFLALGLARASGRPVLVVTTSGSAVANLWPAVIEAHHDGVPLLLVTADRPAELIGVGANQATHQEGIFGFAVRESLHVDAPSEQTLEHDCYQARQVALGAIRAASWGRPGPVHVNMAYREPLSGGQARVLRPSPGWSRAVKPDPLDAEHTDVEVGDGTLVVAGVGAGPAAAEFAQQHRLPLIAEVVSGARAGSTVVPHYRGALRAPASGQVRRVVVFGRPTLSREVTALLSRTDLDILVVDPVHVEPIRFTAETRVVDAVRGHGAASDSWLNSWCARPRPNVPDEDPRAVVADAVWRTGDPGSPLFVAASGMVRVLDEWATPLARPVFSNRGLAGIDGSISTAIGVAHASGLPARALVGDLAFLHDVGGLYLPDTENRPQVQIVVVNDHGGTIFRSLEVARADPALFERVVETPQHVDVESLAAAYSWPYVRLEPSQLAAALLERGTGIFEVPVA